MNTKALLMATATLLALSAVSCGNDDTTESSVSISLSEEKTTEESSEETTSATSKENATTTSSTDASGTATTDVSATSTTTTENLQTEQNEMIVYRTSTGDKYHYINPCGYGTYYAVTLKEAQDAGLQPCEKCVIHGQSNNDSINNDNTNSPESQDNNQQNNENQDNQQNNNQQEDNNQQDNNPQDDNNNQQDNNNGDGENNGQTDEPQKEEVKFNIDFLLSDAKDIISNLGTPVYEGGGAACLTNGHDDKIYQYDGLEIQCYVDGDKEYIFQINITGGDYQTDKGIKVGSSRADVESAYGTGTESGNMIIYSSGNNEMDIQYNDSGDTVISIFFYTPV